MESQFDKEHIDHIPDLNKKYWCSDYSASTGFIYLMKIVLLTKKNGKLIKRIKRYKDIINNQNSEGWTL